MVPAWLSDGDIQAIYRRYQEIYGDDCKRMQKKCKKMQFYLHMSKKSSIFASDFGIVQDQTIKTLRVMEKVEICKVQIGAEIYKVNQLANNDVLLDEYRVMHGRRIAKGGSWFNNRQEAIEFMLRIAFDDVSQGIIEFPA